MKYVVVGGFAAVVHGSSLPTEDVDVVPERTSENLERLAAALQRIGAKLRTEAGPIDAPMDAIRSAPLIAPRITGHFRTSNP